MATRSAASRVSDLTPGAVSAPGNTSGISGRGDSISAAVAAPPAALFEAGKHCKNAAVPMDVGIFGGGRWIRNGIWPILSGIYIKN